MGTLNVARTRAWVAGFGAGGAVRVLAPGGRANRGSPGVDAGRGLAGDAATGRPAGLAESARERARRCCWQVCWPAWRCGPRTRARCSLRRRRCLVAWIALRHGHAARHGLVGGGCRPGPGRGGLVQAGPDRGASPVYGPATTASALGYLVSPDRHERVIGLMWPLFLSWGGPWARLVAPCGHGRRAGAGADSGGALGPGRAGGGCGDAASATTARTSSLRWS